MHPWFGKDCLSRTSRRVIRKRWRTINLCDSVITISVSKNKMFHEHYFEELGAALDRERYFEALGASIDREIELQLSRLSVFDWFQMLLALFGVLYYARKESKHWCRYRHSKHPLLIASFTTMVSFSVILLISSIPYFFFSRFCTVVGAVGIFVFGFKPMCEACGFDFDFLMRRFFQFVGCDKQWTPTPMR